MTNGIFRAYDVRGNVPDELDDEKAHDIARAFIQWLRNKTDKKQLTVVLGRDNRLTSPLLFDAVLHGFLEEGVHVIDVGLCSSPHFYFSVLHLQADGGIHVTASHIPPPTNGLKFAGPQSSPVSPQRNGDGKSIQDLFEELPKLQNNTLGSVESKDTMDAYIARHFEIFPIDKEHLGKKKIKAVIDTGSGVSVLSMQAFTSQLPLTVIPLYWELDGTFPHHVPNPMLPEATKDLQQNVLEEHADLGVALDSDGDRILFIDEKGNRIMSDLTTTLIAQEILNQHQGETILYDLRATHSLPETILSMKGRASVSRVGHTFIKEQMRKEHAFFASEVAGHLYFREIGYYEAPLLAFMYLLSLLSSSSKTLSQLVETIHTYSKTEEINIKITDKEGALKKIKTHYSDANTISHLDGITIEYTDWWVNIRPSNNEDVLRINLEAHTEKLRDEKLQEILLLLKS